MELEFAHAADLPRARAALVDVCKEMHRRGFIAARDGNVSVRVGDKRLLVTPSGSRKGYMRPEDMVLVDLDGKPVRGETGKPSSELMMHTLIYSLRADVAAIVHAHPPAAIAHTIANVSLAAPLMPEVFCELGEILTIPYTTPTTAEVPNALREPMRCHDAVIMERHGSITVGKTLAQAYDRLEVLEHTARISLMANALSPRGVDGLDPEQLAKLRTFLGCGLGC
ncbi:class II aldolase/adducin family protein [Myxococcota bacterium]|nr:class II aldolase/adducin family protein [Myxococcota bacterium]